MDNPQNAIEHVTQHLDRHNDYIAVWVVPVVGAYSTYTDGGEAIEDLLYRVPDTATPHQVGAVIGRAMKAAGENYCEVWPDLSIRLCEKAACGGTAGNVEHVALAYVAVDRIDPAEVIGVPDAAPATAATGDRSAPPL